MTYNQCPDYSQDFNAPHSTKARPLSEPNLSRRVPHCLFCVFTTLPSCKHSKCTACSRCIFTIIVSLGWCVLGKCPAHQTSCHSLIIHHSAASQNATIQ